MRNKFIAVAAIAFAPAFALAQGGGGGTGGTGGNGGTGAGATGGNNGADTTVRRDTGSTAGGAGGVSSTGAAADTGASRDTSTVQSSAEGRISTRNRPPRHSLGLTSDQVKQLQTAINNSGCNAGDVDGVVGMRTRRGIACVRQQKGIAGNDLDDVLSALDLGFTTNQTTTTESGGEVVGGGTGNVNGSVRDTSGNAGRIRPPTGTTSAEPMTHESTRGAQRGTGMHDSTTARTGAASDSMGVNTSRDTSMSTSRDTSLTGTARDTLPRDTLPPDTLSRDTLSRDTLSRDTTGAGMAHDSLHTHLGNDSTPPGMTRDTSRAPR
jgi:hypothetical protein